MRVNDESFQRVDATPGSWDALIMALRECSNRWVVYSEDLGTPVSGNWISARL